MLFSVYSFILFCFCMHSQGCSYLFILVCLTPHHHAYYTAGKKRYSAIHMGDKSHKEHSVLIRKGAFFCLYCRLYPRYVTRIVWD